MLPTSSSEKRPKRDSHENIDIGSTLTLDASGPLPEGTHRCSYVPNPSSTQQIKQELLDGFHFSIFFKEGQGSTATNYGQCWSGYGNEICRMPTFQPGTGEKLLESLVPALLTKPIFSYATCLGPSWDFITMTHFLVEEAALSILHQWPISLSVWKSS
ncbi:ral guanine nucleotide dissociation stimulator-like [Trachypithecus francoisi]|uniref:ral guanine nucleotide dissociation stimulator-like n=1 Tax=Trachypithecus francoisi TaxID=54180 RepID=UPI00141AAE6A|nr:ral guanine nucleotide dissociation stimulator-like [Trachypithecus francoisi]